MDKFNFRQYLLDRYGIGDDEDLTTWGLYYSEIEEMLQVAYLYYQEQVDDKDKLSEL